MTWLGEATYIIGPVLLTIKSAKFGYCLPAYGLGTKGEVGFLSIDFYGLVVYEAKLRFLKSVIVLELL